MFLNTPKKILIIQTAFIGDVILATSILEKIHHSFPESQIDFLLRKGNESLFLQHPFIHRVWIWEKNKKKYIHLFRIIWNIRRQKYDWLINLQRFASTGLISIFARAKYTVGFFKNPFSFFFSERHPHTFHSQHEIKRNHILIAKLTDPFVSKPRLYPTLKDSESVKKYQKKPYICLAPGSAWATKQFPLGKWKLLIEKLPFEGNIYLLGGKEDQGICNRISIETQTKKLVNLSGQLSLLASAALMRYAIINYVNDSAPLHLASAVEAPTCAIFCSTMPAFGFYPLAKKAIIIEVNTKLSCRPCGLNGKKVCPKKHFKCGYAISIIELVDAFLRFKSTYSF